MFKEILHEPAAILASIPGGRSLAEAVTSDLSKYSRGHGWLVSAPEVLAYIEKIQQIQYEVIDGVPRAVLWREPQESRTTYCPFCGERHNHRQDDGLCIPHCRIRQPGKNAPDGTQIKQGDGYIVRTKVVILK